MRPAGIPPFDKIPGQDADVCLIVEGCYPHIMGGVSSWVDWLVRSLPDCSFALVSVVSGDEPRVGKYTFPPNLVRFAELDLRGPPPGRFKGSFKIEPAKCESFADVLAKLVTVGGLAPLSGLISEMEDFPKYPTFQNLTDSEFSWQVVCAMYRRLMPESSFIDFYWAWQSLVGGLFATLMFPLPAARIYHTISTGYAGLLASRAAIETGRRTIVTEHGIYTNERRIEILTADWIADMIDSGLAIGERRMDLRDLC